MALKRLSTGIPGLDPLISGGYKKNSINLVSGQTGCGKSIFALQFIIEGIKKGEPGLYISFDEKKRKVYEDMLELGWDLEKYEESNKLFFLDYAPEQVRKILTEGGGIIEAIIEKNKVKRLVIDSITSFALLYKDELSQKQAGLTLFEFINKWDCTALLTSEDETENDYNITPTLEFEVDGIILLYYIKHKGERKRAIEVLKMRGTKIPNKTYTFDLGTRGIKIDPKKTLNF